jgi:hypothetical protein
VRFYWIEEGEKLSEDGVILVRYIPEAPPPSFWNCEGKPSIDPGKGDDFEVFDLRVDPPGGLLCEMCSKRLQRPVRHVRGSVGCKEASKEAVSSAVKTQCKGLSGPDPERIGPEAAEYAKELKRQKAPIGTHRCQVRTRLDDLCSFHHYNSATKANTHMRKYHKLEHDDSLMYPSTAKKKQSNGKFLCKWEGCDKRYVHSSRANKHMVDTHGVSNDSELLHPIPEKKKQKRSKQRGKIQEKNGKAAAAHESEGEGEGDETEQEEASDEGDSEEEQQAEVEAEVEEEDEMSGASEKPLLCPYDRQRLVTIAANKAYMSAMGLVPESSPIDNKVKSKPQKKKPAPRKPTRSAPLRACKDVHKSYNELDLADLAQVEHPGQVEEADPEEVDKEDAAQDEKESGALSEEEQDDGHWIKEGENEYYEVDFRACKPGILCAGTCCVNSSIAVIVALSLAGMFIDGRRAFVFRYHLH